jgi:hypothetical protein
VIVASSITDQRFHPSSPQSAPLAALISERFLSGAPARDLLRTGAEPCHPELLGLLAVRAAGAASRARRRHDAPQPARRAPASSARRPSAGRVDQPCRQASAPAGGKPGSAASWVSGVAILARRRGVPSACEGVPQHAMQRARDSELARNGWRSCGPSYLRPSHPAPNRAAALTEHAARQRTRPSRHLLGPPSGGIGGQNPNKKQAGHRRAARRRADVADTRA